MAIKAESGANVLAKLEEKGLGKKKKGTFKQIS